MKKINLRLLIFLRNSHIDKDDNLKEMKKYLTRVNDNFRIDREKKHLEKTFHKMAIIFKVIITIARKIAYVILINRITTSSIADTFTPIIKFKLEIDISEFTYFNYKKSNHVRKSYNV